MKVKFTWETMVSKEEAEYDIDDMSKECLVNIIKFLFNQIPGSNSFGNMCFNLQDYFIFQVAHGKRNSTVGITREELEEVIGIIVMQNTMVIPIQNNKLLH